MMGGQEKYIEIWGVEVETPEWPDHGSLAQDLEFWRVISSERVGTGGPIGNYFCGLKSAESQLDSTLLWIQTRISAESEEIKIKFYYRLSICIIQFLETGCNIKA